MNIAVDWNIKNQTQTKLKLNIFAVILLPAHPASFAHKFLYQRVPASPGKNSIGDLSLKIVCRTHKFAVGTH